MARFAAPLFGLVLAVVAALALFHASPAGAGQTVTWSAAGGGNWSNGANWIGGVAPTTGDTVVFPAGLAPQTATDDLVGLSLASIKVQSPSLTIAGATPVTLSAGLIVDTYSGSSTVSLVMNGAGSVDMSATGTLVLSANNGFSGGVVVRAGTVSGTTNANAFGTGSITLGDSIGAANATLNGGFVGPFTNAITVALGSTGVLKITNTAITTFSGAVTLNNDLTTTPANFNLTLSGTIGGDGTRTITNSGAGTGTTTISGAVSSNVTTVVESSTTTALTITGALTVNSTGTTLTNALGTKVLTLSGGTTGTGTLTLDNDSATANGITVSTNGINHSGALVNSGSGAGTETIAVVTTGLAANITTITESSTTSALTISGPVTVSSAGTTLTNTLGTKALTISGAISGGGNLVLTNNSATNAAVTVAAVSVSGSITNNGTGAGSVTVSGAVASSVDAINENSNSSLLTVSGALAMNAGGTTFTTTSSAKILTVSGAITGSGNLVLNNNGTFAAGITVSNATVNPGGTITNSGSGIGTTLISGVIGGAVTGVIQNSGSSQLTLSGNNAAFGGGSTIKAGTLSGTTSANAFGTSGITIGDSSGTASATLNGGFVGPFVNDITVALGSSGPLKITNTAITTFGGALTLNNDLTTAPANFALTLSGAVGGSGSRTITNSGSGTGTTTVSGSIAPNVVAVAENSNTSALTVSGSLTLGNTLTLSSTSTAKILTVSGNITGSGDLVLNNNGSFASGITVSSASVNQGGTITNSGSNGGAGSTLISGVVGGAVTSVIQNSASSQLSLSGSNAFTGLVIKAGTVTGTTSATAFGASTITLGDNSTNLAATLLAGFAGPFPNPITVAPSSGVLKLSNNTAATFSGPVTMNNDLTLVPTLTNLLTLSGNITGTGNLSITGTGTTASVALSGTTVNPAGTISNNGTNTGTSTISAAVGSAVTAITEAGTSAITVSGPFTIAGATTLTSTSATKSLTVSGNITGSGDLVLNNNSALANGITLSNVNNTGTVTNQGVNAGTGTVAITAVGSSVTAINENTNTSALTISGTLNVAGTTTLTTTSTAKILTVSGNITGLGDLVLNNNGPFASGITLSSVNNAGTVTNQGANVGTGTVAITTVGSSVTAINESSDSSALTISGTLNLAGTTLVTNTSAAKILTLSGGTLGTGNLTLNNNGPTAGGIALSGAIANIGTITNSGSGAAVTVSGIVSGSATVVVQNSPSSTLTLSGVNTFTGGVTIKAGTVSGTTSASAFGTGTITVGDAVVNLAATLSGGVAGPFTNAITVAAGTTLRTITNTIATTFNGVMTLNGDVTFTAGATNLTLGAVGAAGTGSRTITNDGAAGTVTVGSVGSFVSAITENSTTSALTVTGLVTVNSGGTTLTNKLGTKVLTVSGGTTGAGDLTLDNQSTLAGGINLTGTTNNGGAVVNVGTGSGTSSVTMAAVGSSVTAITEASDTSTLTISGLFTVNAGGTVVTNANSKIVTISGGTAGTGNLTLSNNGPTTGGIALSGGVANVGVISNSGTGSGVTISGIISAAATSVVQNSATSQLTVSGVNTFNGGLTIKAGTVSGTTSANAFGANTNVIMLGEAGSAANATLNGSFAGTHANLITSPAGVTGTLRITNGANAIFSGLITLNSPLTLNASGASTLTLSGGVTGTGNLTITNNSSVATTLSGATSVNPAGFITDDGSGPVTISAPIGTSVSGVIHDSTNTLTLSGASTFTSGVTVKKGTVSGTNIAAFGTGTITLGDSGANNPATLNGGLAGTFANAINVAGSTTGLLKITSSAASIFSGLVTLANDLTLAPAASALTLSGGVTGTGSLTIATTGAGTTTLSGATGINVSGSIANSGGGVGATTISAVISSPVAGVVQDSPTSQLTLTGANTFATGVTIKRGTASGATSAAAFGTGTITLGDSTANNPATLSGGIAGIANHIAIAPTTSGQLKVTNSAATTFTGSIDLDNDLTIAAANFTLGLSGLAGPINGTGSITNSGAGTGVVTISGVLGASVGPVTENSASSQLTLSGNNASFAGGVTIKAGTVSGASSANAFGTGTITIGDSSGSANATLNGGFLGPFINPITVSSGTTGTLKVTNTAVASFSGGLDLNNDLTTTPANFALGLSGPIMGTGCRAITNSGAGTGTTTFSGAVGSNICGIAETSNTSALTVSGLVTVNGGGTTLTSTSTGKAFTISSGVAGTGSLVLKNNGTFANGITLSGATSVANGGTISNSGTGSGSVLISAPIGGNVTAVTQASSTSMLTMSGALTVNPLGTTLTNTTGTALTLSGGTSGAGTGDLVLDNASGTANAIAITAALNHVGAITNLSSGASETIGVAVGNNTGITQDSTTAALTINGLVTVNSGGSTLSNDVNAAALTLGGGIAGAGNLTLVNKSATVDAIAITGGTVNNSGSVTNSGAGTGSESIGVVIGANVTSVVQTSPTSMLILGGNNSAFTGGVKVKAGTVRGTTSANAFGTAAIVLGEAGGTASATLDAGFVGPFPNAITVAANTSGLLSITSSAASTFSGAVSLNHALSLAPTATPLALSGGVGGTGNLTISSSGTGTMTLSGASAVNHIGTITNNGTGGATTTISAPIGSNVSAIAEASTSSSLVISGQLTVPGGGTTISDAFAGPTVTLSGGITGTGFLVLRNDSATAGGVTVATGGVNMNHTGTVVVDGSDTGSVVVSAPITANVTTITQASATSPLAVSGALTVAGTGTTLSDTLGAALTLTGGTTGTGNLVLDNDSATTAGITLSAASVNHTGSLTNSGSGTGSAAVSSVIGSNGTGVTQASATSPLALSGVNTVAAPTTLSAGSLIANASEALGSGTGPNTLVFSGGGLQATGTFTSPSARSVTLTGAGTIDTNGNTVTVAGGISGAGGLTKIGAGSLLPTGATSVGGSLTISGGTLVAPSASAFSVAGGWTNDATFDANGGTVTLNGSSAQAIGGSSPTTFDKLTLNNAAGATVSTSPTVATTLTLTTGKITTGANKVSVGASGSISGAGTGRYVNGNLERAVPNAASPMVVFPVGDATAYAPVTLSFAGTTTGSGSITASTTAGTHPSHAQSGIKAVKDVNRWWTLANSGVGGFTSYTSTFSWVAGDVDGGAATGSFVVRRVNGGTWSAPAADSQAATSIRALGLTGFGDFLVGEMEAAGSASTLTPTSSSITADGSSTQVLTVRSKDVNGNDLPAGGLTVTITQQSGAGSIGTVTDIGDGSYIATVTAPTSSGSGVFVATIEGVAVKSGGAVQTQATVTYTAGAPSAAMSTVTPTSATIVAGSGTQLVTVQARDVNGNNLTTGGATVTVVKLSGTGSVGSVTDVGNGTYTATVAAPSTSGSGVFVATLGAAAVKSGGATQTQVAITYAVGTPSATMSTLSPSLATITADGTSTKVLTVQARDVNGNNLIIGGSSVTITRDSGTGSIGAVTDLGNGSYTATVTAPTLSGSGVFVAAIAGSPVRGGGSDQSQATVTYAPGPASGAVSTLTPATGKLTADGSSTQILTVRAKDANGNERTSGGDLVTVTRLSGSGAVSSVSDVGDGSYVATVTAPTTVGTGAFGATISGQEVKGGSTAQTQVALTYVPGKPSAAVSTLTPATATITADGSELRAASVVANGFSSQVLTVTAKDAQGNLVGTGGAQVSFTRVSGTGSVGAVTDGGDGTYTATVTSPPATGEGVFVAVLGGEAVRGGGTAQTQAKVTYVAGQLSPAMSTLAPSGASIPANGFSTQVLTVTARDRNGNDVPTGGAVVSIVKLSGSGSVSAVSDVGDGSYVATVTAPTTAGSGAFMALLGGVPVRGGGASAAQATVTYTTNGASLSNAPAEDRRTGAPATAQTDPAKVRQGDPGTMFGPPAMLRAVDPGADRQASFEAAASVSRGAEGVVTAGGRVQAICLSGCAGPESLVTVWVASDPVKVAVVRASTAGGWTATADLPPMLEPGLHRVIAVAVDAAGRPAFFANVLRVVASSAVKAAPRVQCPAKTAVGKAACSRQALAARTFYKGRPYPGKIFVIGSKGKDVIILQQAFGVREDGRYTTQLFAAVQAFQQQQRLKITAHDRGAVNRVTWKALFG